ncbi:tyrosine-type recombinase/integrase [Nonomuraea turcica]|uniref:tyrosine-type recombinase/integrase n=1 Tax=Nonomuraea sp. G32 TaxID=3067274 RepID=UPI00273B5738|nr:tyrosine-type recombinase/integrase [Nonomuraea sp. G32]MDP4510320.1 tyrosine-type recombinase/integrase [Nonomuraea sp. G32]
MERARRALQTPLGAAAFLEASLVHLNLPQAVFEAMLEEFDRQQAARGLAVDTRRGRERLVRQLRASSDAWPWEWLPSHFDAWSAAHLRQGRTKATLRGYQNAIVAFCAFIADPRYRWGEVCERLFGMVPAQVTHDLNLIRHKGDYEGRPEANRPLARAELDTFFSTVNARAETAARLHRKGAATAHRDAVMFLTMLGWGTRRTETACLDVDDFRRNAKSPQFGQYGVLVVRNAKSFPGGPPRRRSVLTAFPWAAQAVQDWVERVRSACYPEVESKVLFPTERLRRITPRQINLRFAAIRDEAGLPNYLNPHCLRHSYTSTSFEMGWPMALVQDQLGHTHVATTAVYTALSDDFKDRVLYDSLGMSWDDHNPAGGAR